MFDLLEDSLLVAADVSGRLKLLVEPLPELHAPGARDQHRAALESAIDAAETILPALASVAVAERALLELRWLLLRAYAARAEHARYGAGQLSRGAQRAPTRDACEEGWRRVAGIVAVAENAEQNAVRLGEELRTARAEQMVAAARRAAAAAHQIMAQRNDAYTFHADPKFSFGEGWYVAAAAVLDRVTIQIEPNQPQTTAAELFLVQAGLGQQLVAYRPRPRANKALVDIVARAFRADARAAQAKLRAAFLGSEPVAQPIIDWTCRALSQAPPGKKVLVWVRAATHQPERNSPHTELVELCLRALEEGLVPIVVGDGLRATLPPGALDLTLFWKLPLFQQGNMRRSQLQLFEWLRQAYGLCGQVGVTTAGMDGPALMGLSTLYLTHEPNVRLGKWVGAVPGYEELVRGDQHLERISRSFMRWAVL